MTFVSGDADRFGSMLSLVSCAPTRLRLSVCLGVSANFSTWPRIALTPLEAKSRFRHGIWKDRQNYVPSCPVTLVKTMTAETRVLLVHSSLFLFLCPTRGIDLGLPDAVLGRRHGFVRPRQNLVLPDAEVLAYSILFVVQYAGTTGSTELAWIGSPMIVIRDARNRHHPPVVAQAKLHLICTGVTSIGTCMYAMMRTNHTSYV